MDVGGRPFDSSWESLAQYTVPRWYEDAKFGIFIHWGPYSVPAFGNEWYPRRMYQWGTPEYAHHLATYGPHKSFGYKDFFPLFTASEFDASAWARLFKESGARFVVPVAEHHDGFAMYDTALSRWNAVALGPKRDVIGELASAVRDEGLVFGVSNHRIENFWFFDGGLFFDSGVEDPADADLYGPPHQAFEHLTPEFMQDWLDRACEVVDKYAPQLVWFDWHIEAPALRPYLQQFAAHYYNAMWERGDWDSNGAAINYKYDAFPDGAAVFDVERGALAGIREHFWQTDTAISKNSWGYVTDQDYKTAGSLIGDLVDVVSKNGALLLNIGPRGDGTIPEAEQEILREIGRWLAVNGEAIYGTRPWRVFGEGPTEIAEGHFTDTDRADFTPEDIRFTTNGDNLYAMLLAWPGESVLIRSLAGVAVTSVRMLGTSAELSWQVTPEGLRVALPATPPGQHATTLKLQPVPQ